MIHLLIGEYIARRAKLIAVYVIYAPPGRSDCGCEAENEGMGEGLLPNITSIVHLKDSANNPPPMKAILNLLMIIRMVGQVT